MNSKNEARPLRWQPMIGALVVAIGLTPFTALAGMVDFGVTTFGSGSWAGSCGAACNVLDLSGSSTLSGLDGYFGSSSTPAFTFSAQLDLTERGPWLGGAGLGGWSLQDGSGDSLFGSVEGWLSGTASSPSRGAGFYYDVTGGSGVFNDASGVGGSLALFQPFPGNYAEGGEFLVSTSAPVHVPEPDTLGLLVAALPALAWSMRRRRRAAVRAA